MFFCQIKKINLYIFELNYLFQLNQIKFWTKIIYLFILFNYLSKFSICFSAENSIIKHFNLFITNSFQSRINFHLNQNKQPIAIDAPTNATVSIETLTPEAELHRSVLQHCVPPPLLASPVDKATHGFVQPLLITIVLPANVVKIFLLVHRKKPFFTDNNAKRKENFYLLRIRPKRHCSSRGHWCHPRHSLCTCSSWELGWSVLDRKPPLGNRLRIDVSFLALLQLASFAIVFCVFLFQYFVLILNKDGFCCSCGLNRCYCLIE
jgi:hypothetical protein